MVSSAISRNYPLNTELADDYSDTESTSTSSISDSGVVSNFAAVLFDDEETSKNKDHQLVFGNVAITNSSDVHFGNKTYYQGPVTIKQFLYANSNSGSEDLNKGLNDVNQCKEKCAEEGHARNNDCKKDRKDVESDIQSGNGADALEKSKLKKDLQCTWYKKSYIIYGIGIILLILLSVAVLCSFLVPMNDTKTSINADENTIHHDSSEQDTILEQPNIDFSKNVSFPKKLRLISRIEWLAQPPLYELDNLTLPVPYVIISHTATENCTKIALCVLIVRNIQSFHIESRNWWDIGYNFLVGGDGNAYIGRGWTKEGSHTYGYNLKSIGIAFIGTFMNVKPPSQQIAACKYLIEKGVELGYIMKDYKLLAARQLQTTESPGEFLYQEMKSWSHWVESL